MGLLYDKEALQGALDLVSDWTAGERSMLRRKVSDLTGSGFRCEINVSLVCAA